MPLSQPPQKNSYHSFESAPASLKKQIIRDAQALGSEHYARPRYRDAVNRVLEESRDQSTD